MINVPRWSAFAALVACAGCFGSGETIPVNLDFARTNYGYINSGGYKAGSFFSWDREAEQLVYLGQVPGFETPDNPDVQTIRAEYQAGVELGGEFRKIAKASADAAIRSKSLFEIENGNRVAFNNVYSKLTGFLSKDTQEGGSTIEEWGLLESIGNRDQLYVIVRDVTYGDTIRLLVDGEAKVGGSFAVSVQDGSVNIRIDGRGLEGIEGENVAVSFFVYVLEPYWKQGDGAQTLAVRRVTRLDISDLPELLRSVGEAS